MDLLTREAWRCIGASVAGVSHGRTGQPCQDAFGYNALEDGTIIAAVADGAGSAELGRDGAQLGVESAISLLSTAVTEAKPSTYWEWSVLFGNALAGAQNAIAEKATSMGKTPQDFAATLFMIAAQPDWIAYGSIGDCAAVIQDQRGELQSLSAPQRGEYANATHFLTGTDAQERLTVGLRLFPSFRSNAAGNSITHIALLTDGLLELALNVAHNCPFEPFFQPLFAFASEVDSAGEAAAAADLAGFLNSDRINARTHDDKTLLLLSRLG